MKKLYGFSLFLLYNSLSDEVLLKAIKFLQYEQVNAGTFIFHQGDQSNKFYGIIKGKISIRAKKARNLLNTNTNEYVEIMQMTEGMCFGEWAIIYNIERTASAYVLEDSHLFSIEKDKFKTVFAKWLFKAENDRREFIKKTIPFLGTIPEIRFEEYYKRSVFANFYRRNEVIYDQNTITGSLYAIYQGECSLQNKNSSYYKTILSDHIIKKNIHYSNLFSKINKLKKNNTNNKKEKSNEINDTLVRLGVGGIGGLEICCGLVKMRHICVSSSQITTVLRVDIMNIPEAREKILKSLLDVYISVEKFIHQQFLEKKKKTKTINYRNPLKKEREFNLIGYLTYAGNIEYNDKYLEIDEAGLIKENEKNEMVLCDVNKYYELNGRVDKLGVPLNTELEFKEKINKISVRTLNDTHTQETLSKLSDVVLQKNINYVNTFFEKPVIRKRNLKLHSIKSCNHIFKNKILTLTTFPNHYNYSDRKSNGIKSTTQETIATNTKRCFSNEKPSIYKFDSGSFKLPFITLSDYSYKK